MKKQDNYYYDLKSPQSDRNGKKDNLLRVIETEKKTKSDKETKTETEINKG